jgi:lipoyl(octanoyl) transferase
LSFFSNIIPCGIDDKAVTSMKNELGREVDLEEVTDKLLVHLAELFNFKANKILNE